MGGAKRAVVSTSPLTSKLPVPNDSCRVIFTAGVQLASDIKKWGRGQKKKVLFLHSNTSSPFALRKALQSLDSHLRNCLTQTLLELKHIFRATTISALAGSKKGF